MGSLDYFDDLPKGIPPSTYYTIIGVMTMIFTYVTDYPQPFYTILWLIGVFLFVYGVFNE